MMNRLSSSFSSLLSLSLFPSLSPHQVCLHTTFTQEKSKLPFPPSLYLSPSFLLFMFCNLAGPCACSLSATHQIFTKLHIFFSPHLTSLLFAPYCQILQPMSSGSLFLLSLSPTLPLSLLSPPSLSPSMIVI